MNILSFNPEQLGDLEDRLREAVRQFWLARDQQQHRQAESGRVDAGTRGSVTGGKHMVPLESLVVEIIKRAGLERPTVETDVELSRLAVNTGTKLELPGYYRPEKRWDMLVLWHKQLVAAIEFKSLVGSFGKNLNNRAEEAIGSAEDLWKAHRERLLGDGPEPFLGYFFLLQDCPEVHTTVGNCEPHFKVDPEFKGVSYSKRYELLCRRLVRERKYSAACFILATKGDDTRITQPADDLSFRRFAAKLVGDVQAFILGQ